MSIEFNYTGLVFFGYFNVKSFRAFNLKSKLQLTLSVKSDLQSVKCTVMLMKYICFKK